MKDKLGQATDALHDTACDAGGMLHKLARTTSRLSPSERKGIQRIADALEVAAAQWYLADMEGRKAKWSGSTATKVGTPVPSATPSQAAATPDHGSEHAIVKRLFG